VWSWESSQHAGWCWWSSSSRRCVCGGGEQVSCEARGHPHARYAAMTCAQAASGRGRWHTAACSPCADTDFLCATHACVYLGLYVCCCAPMQDASELRTIWRKHYDAEAYAEFKQEWVHVLECLAKPRNPLDWKGSPACSSGSESFEQAK
jgi:hypothetical protein